MPPLVSVIVPLYNRKSYIARCVGSVLHQGFRDWELIIVDDGSTDHPEEILTQLQAQDARIRVVYQPNGGVSSARNAGLSVAEGEYIQFLDSDDALLPESLEQSISAARHTQADVVAFCSLKKSVRVQKNVEETPLVFHEAQTAISFLMQRGLLCTPWNKLWRKDLIGEVRFPEGVSWGEDFIFNLSVFSACHTCAYLQKQLYDMAEESPLSLSHTYSPNGFSDLLAQAQAIDALLQKMPSAEMQKCFDDYLWACYMQCVKKLSVGAALSYTQKLEVLRQWASHPIVMRLRKNLLRNRTLVSWLMAHEFVKPVPFVQRWVVRKSRVAASLRSLYRLVLGAGKLICRA